MVIESSQQPVKRGRGRPRKTETPVVASKAKASKAAPVAAKKAPAHVSHPHHDASWEDELAAFERRSNKSGVLTLLVLLLGIALIGYGMYLKLNQADTSDAVKPTHVTTTDTLPAQPEQTGKTAPAASNSLISDFFTYVNNGQFDKLAAIEDSSFKSLGTLKTYFNNTRLQTFSKNIIGGIRVENIQANTTDPVLTRNATAKAYDFTVRYTLKSDEKEYTDQWRGYTIVKGTNTVINGFVYTGTGVANSPFFQFSKFGIK